jgi:hypothetical protein
MCTAVTGFILVAPKRLAVTDSFDDYAQNYYINCDYIDF